MIVNPKIKLLFAEIATKANKLANSKEDRKKYIRKLVKLYTTKMSEEEQIYLAMELFEQISYRNIVIDPDTLVAMNNVKHRTYFIIFILAIITMVTGAALFKTNSSLNEVLQVLEKVSTMMSF